MKTTGLYIVALDDRSPLNALNEPDWALHLMIGHRHVGQQHIQQYLCKPINIQLYQYKSIKFINSKCHTS